MRYFSLTSNPNSAACDDKANHALHIRIAFKSGVRADAQLARASDSVSNAVCAVVAPRDGLWVAAGWAGQMWGARDWAP